MGETLSKEGVRERGDSWGDVVLARSYLALLSPALRRRPLPSVPRVDCDDCRRVKEGTASFSVRCCDVLPRLSNFLVGEILTAGGHPRVEQWLLGRRGDPYFVQVPPTLAKAHLEARFGGKFGLPCPLLVPDQGRCSIYTMRPPLCIGYHCYYPNPFWLGLWSCLTSTLELLQDTATRYLVAQAGFSLGEMASVWRDFADEKELWEGESQHEKAYKAFWQHWQGREEEFYRDCYAKVREGGASLREALSALHREFLIERLARESRLDASRERELREERYTEEHLTPLAPPKALRLQYQKSYVAAEENELTHLEQQRILLWYLERLDEPTFWDAVKGWFGLGS